MSRHAHKVIHVNCTVLVCNAKYFVVLSATWMGDSYETAISVLHTICTNIGDWYQVVLRVAQLLPAASISES